MKLCIDPLACQGSCLSVDEIDDTEDFEAATTAMAQLNIDDATKRAMFQVLAAILNLGSIR